MWKKTARIKPKCLKTSFSNGMIITLSSLLEQGNCIKMKNLQMWLLLLDPSSSKPTNLSSASAVPAFSHCSEDSVPRNMSSSPRISAHSTWSYYFIQFSRDRGQLTCDINLLCWNIIYYLLLFSVAILKAPLCILTTSNISRYLVSAEWRWKGLTTYLQSPRTSNINYIGQATQHRCRPGLGRLNN